MNKNIKKIIILLYKVAVTTCLISVFFVVFKAENQALSRLSRTLAITISTYMFGLTVTSKIYGFLKIGEIKSKQVVFNSYMALLITNLVTYLQLMIMNTNPNNAQSNSIFTLEHQAQLILTLIVQFAIVYMASYFGNWLYFKLFEALRTLIIYDKNDNLNKIENTLKKYKLQFEIVGIIRYNNQHIDDYIANANYVVLTGLESPVKGTIINKCYEANIIFTIERSIQNVVLSSGTIDVIDDIPTKTIYAETMTLIQRISKRTFDIVISVLALMFLMPVIVFCSILIKLNDGGKIFFLQERATRDHKIFKVIKFRTMHENVENFSSTGSDDQRITRIGKILRKTRFDEVPQFVNIFLGQMSLVGPRPEMLANIEAYEKELPEFKYRLKVKAGLTGLAQIEGKYNTTPYDKLVFDLTYIENYSFWLDIKLLLKTVLVFNKMDSTQGFGDQDHKG